MADARLAPVEAWSLRIHDPDSPRHHWCMAAAAALLADEAPPPFPGRSMPGVPEARLETMRRLLGLEARP